MNDLSRFWTEFGVVTGLWIIYDRKKDCKAVAWISQRDSAERIVDHWNNKEEREYEFCNPS